MILILQIQLIKQLNRFKTLPWKERLPPSCLAHTAPLPLMCQYYNLSTLRENRAMELNRFFCSSDFLLVYHESQWGPYKCNCWHEESRILLQDCSFQELIGRVLQHRYIQIVRQTWRGKKKWSGIFRRFLKKLILSHWYSKTINKHEDDLELWLTALHVNEKLGRQQKKWPN